MPRAAFVPAIFAMKFEPGPFDPRQRYKVLDQHEVMKEDLAAIGQQPSLDLTPESGHLLRKKPDVGIDMQVEI